ncbi:MAG: ABC transporter ATP-binding protein [Planctomycetes bacterium]|nr:ABC transporter ATP-binding protein [Planctomycetota bacterium]MCP4838472.1 ABC transporter ATP-binding protein [Planctomycetota bacterium]
MIETINLTRTYGDLIALDNLNLTVDRGACFGFIGPNGAGKTTTIRILSTLLKPSWGEARIDGLTIGYQNSLIRPIIGYVPDFIGTYDDMLVSEYLEFFAACYGIHGSKRRTVVAEALELTDLTTKAGSQVDGLSRGMSQRLSIARVLLHDPQVLLMDEPASGLDPRARIEIRELLKELQRLGKTILISSHILSELSELCDTVGIIEQGKLCFSGSMQSALEAAEAGCEYEVIVEQRSSEAAQLLTEAEGISRVKVVKTNGVDVLHVTVDRDRPIAAAEIPARLITAGFRLSQFQRGQVNLETAFMHHTKGIVA